MPASPSVRVGGLIPGGSFLGHERGFHGRKPLLPCAGSMIAVSHISRSRRFDTRETSTNNWWVALLGFGDGWHKQPSRLPRLGPTRAEVACNSLHLVRHLHSQAVRICGADPSRRMV